MSTHHERPGIERRAFIAAGVGAGLAVLAGSAGSRSASARIPGVSDDPKPVGASSKLRILILGGTGFLGPALLDAARARGHSVTLFNRGKTEKRKPGQFEDVEKLYGNRDPKLRADETDDKSPLGLSALEGKTWDAAIDTSGYVPRIVKASCDALSKSVKHYTFISTISVYAANDKPDADESAELGTIDDPTIESMGARSENYGPLKALCEKTAEETMPGRVLNVRPGFIVGPGDPTDRFTYWPVRAARGGDMLVPGDGSEPVQFIDVRDLAEWTIRCIEAKRVGVFNATGPSKALPFRDLAQACVDAAKGGGGAGVAPNLVWVPTDFLEQNQVSIGGDLPIWIPPVGEYAGFHSRSIAKAVAAGLTFRTPLDTCKATLEWWPRELERRTKVTAQMLDDALKAGKETPKMADPSKLRVGLSPAREAEVLAKWKERSSATPAAKP